MAAAQLGTRARVAMVRPPYAIVATGVADLRAEPRSEAELVDQAHYNEAVRVLGARGEWRYVQGPDHYFGWTLARHLHEAHPAARELVATLLADVHADPSEGSAIVARFPTGTPLAARSSADGWSEIPLYPAADGSARRGFIRSSDLAATAALPGRYPTADDLVSTAEAFLGVPYLWGGTTVNGLDCSGFVQQVYRLNGVGLPRDADQQALFGRRVDEANPGDLLFFGKDSVTHVALATGARDFLHAPQSGAFVERASLGPERTLRAIRRYLAEP